jgi:hypothetical protein
MRMLALSLSSDMQLDYVVVVEKWHETKSGGWLAVGQLPRCAPSETRDTHVADGGMTSGVWRVLAALTLAACHPVFAVGDLSPLLAISGALFDGSTLTLPSGDFGLYATAALPAGLVVEGDGTTLRCPSGSPALVIRCGGGAAGNEMRC